MPLKFNWFYKFRNIGKTLSIDLEHGDMYIMSEKATDLIGKNQLHILLDIQRL